MRQGTNERMPFHLSFNMCGVFSMLSIIQEKKLKKTILQNKEIIKTTEHASISTIVTHTITFHQFQV